MAGSWGYPEQTHEIVDMGEPEPTGPEMVEVMRGVYVQPTSVIALHVNDQKTVKLLLSSGASLSAVGDIHSVLDRLDCRTYHLPSAYDPEEG